MTDSGQLAIAPKLAALAQWQERVLANPLVARARTHKCPSVDSFIRRQYVPHQHAEVPPNLSMPTAHLQQYVPHAEVPPNLSMLQPIQQQPPRRGSILARVMPWRKHSLDNRIDMNTAARAASHH